VKKTSLYLDPELDERLAQRAAEEGLTKAEFIRRGLARLVDPPRRVKPQAIGVARLGSLPRDLSARDEEYMGDDFGR
jgi:hypothetical protein